MTTSKHTAGTWGVGFLNDAWDEWQVDGPGSFTTVYIGDPGSDAPAAIVTQPGVNGSECEERAQLLAAAPDLLEALEMVLAVVEYVEEADYRHLLSVDQWKQAQDAIAKARGES